MLEIIKFVEIRLASLTRGLYYLFRRLRSVCHHCMSLETFPKSLSDLLRYSINMFVNVEKKLKIKNRIVTFKKK